MGKRFLMSLTLPDTPYDPAAAAEAFEAAGWRTEPGEAFGGRPLLKATHDHNRLTASVGAEGRTLRISGEVPTVWIHRTWTRPPRVATVASLRSGEQLCTMCEGWGTCRTCEGLGFWKSRVCPECGLGTTCPDCQGTGTEPVPPG